MVGKGSELAKASHTVDLWERPLKIESDHKSKEHQVNNH